MSQRTDAVVKALLYVFNILFLLSGLLFTIVGAMTRRRAKDYCNNFLEGHGHTPSLLVVTGVFVFLVALFGFFALIKENYILLMTFSGLLFIVGLIEICWGLAAIIHREKLRTRLTIGMKKGFANYNSGNFPKVKTTWNKMQKKERCCGVNGFVDYVDKRWEIPESCCQEDKNDICQVYKKGCAQAIFGFLSTNMKVIGSVGLVVGFLQITAIYFACHVARVVKRREDMVIIEPL